MSGYQEKQSEDIIKEVEAAQEKKERAASYNELDARRKVVEAFLGGLKAQLSRNESMGSFLEMLRFYFSNPPKKSLLKKEDLLVILEKADRPLLEKRSKELVKEMLALDPKKLQELKDDTGLTDKAMGIWMDKLDGLVCKPAELKKYFDEQKALFEAALKPEKTPDGYALHFPNLLYLLQAAIPHLLGEEPIVGVNVDGTEMGGRSTTSASVRFLNEELDFRGLLVNSRGNEFFFILYEGGEDRIYLDENIMRTGEEGMERGERKGEI